jgi:bifunctional non-homologous end joining protein LigD
MGVKTQLAVGGTKVKVSNLDKVFYPKTGFTKGDVIDYYVRVSPFLLPHLKGRPITLKRFPDGVDGFFFYEKRCPAHRPGWVKTAKVTRSKGGRIDYCLFNDLRALIWAVNLADLELHTFLHKAPALERPTAVAFDLDPGLRADNILCGRVALRLKAMLDATGLQSFPKTSGSKGLQIYVPLNQRVTYEQTKAFAHAVTKALEAALPDAVVAQQQKSRREGKVLVDWGQNDAHKTTINVYSLRAMDHPTVSTPVTWREIEDAVKRNNARLLSFEASEVLKRVERRGDLFAPVLRLKQTLPAAGTAARRLPVRAAAEGKGRARRL